MESQVLLLKPSNRKGEKVSDDVVITGLVLWFYVRTQVSLEVEEETLGTHWGLGSVQGQPPTWPCDLGNIIEPSNLRFLAWKVATIIPNWGSVLENSLRLSRYNDLATVPHIVGVQQILILAILHTYIVKISSMILSLLCRGVTNWSCCKCRFKFSVLTSRNKKIFHDDHWLPVLHFEKFFLLLSTDKGHTLCEL